jgi:hypothetical protein
MGEEAQEAVRSTQRLIGQVRESSQAYKETMARTREELRETWGFIAEANRQLEGSTGLIRGEP